MWRNPLSEAYFSAAQERLRSLEMAGLYDTGAPQRIIVEKVIEHHVIVTHREGAKPSVEMDDVIDVMPEPQQIEAPNVPRAETPVQRKTEET